MYVQGEIAVNAPMLEGSLQHSTRADKVGKDTDDRGRLVRRRLWVWSEQYKIAGFADLVEQEGDQLIPVEFKHGKKSKWDNDQIQLCAQALCLEEMTGSAVPQGEIFYWKSRRRIQVPFDTTLRQLTIKTIEQANQLLQQNRLPDPIQESKKCTYCSIQPICMPAEVQKLTK